jgi:hypothetical protein
MSPIRVRAWLPAALGAAGLAALAAPGPRALLESKMSLHMAVQLPAIAACGALLAWSGRNLLARTTGTINQQGASGFLLALFVMAPWMLPRMFDRVLLSPMLEVTKFAALALAGAVALLSWRAAGAVTQAFVIGNAAWMLFTAGLLVQDVTVRLCNAYMIDDQVVAGRLLVGFAALMSLAWLGRLAARHLPRRRLVGGASDHTKHLHRPGTSSR